MSEMFPLSTSEDDDNFWPEEVIAFLDALLSLVVALLVLANPPAHTDTNTKAIFPLSFELHWNYPCEKHDDDVDLWVQAPGGAPVGYSNKTGIGVSLVRDDLGPGADPDSVCMEQTVASVIRPGEYVVNAHLYSVRSPPPVPLVLVVKLNLDGKRENIIVRKEAVLLHQNQEITIVRFTLDASGNLVPGSVNDLRYPFIPGAP